MAFEDDPSCTRDLVRVSQLEIVESSILEFNELLSRYFARFLFTLVEILAVRGKLFLIGATCFLLARGVSMWLAMHPTVRPHGG